METTTPKRLLTEDDVAQLLGVCPRTLQAWRLQRRILPFVKVGRTVRYAADVVENYLAKNTVAVDAK